MLQLLESQVLLPALPTRGRATMVRICLEMQTQGEELGEGLGWAVTPSPGQQLYSGGGGWLGRFGEVVTRDSGTVWG